MKITETKNLVIKELNTGDADFILELVNDPDWINFIGDRGVKTKKQASKYILDRHVKSYLDHGFGLYVVKIKGKDIPIGICGLVKRSGLEDVDIGFAFLPQYRGKGYAYESAIAVLNYARIELGIHRVVAITSPENEPSARLLERLGLKFDKLIKLPNQEEDSCLFIPA